MLRRSTTITVPFSYRLRFTQEVFHPTNPALAEIVGKPTPRSTAMLVFADQGVLDCWPDLPNQVERYAAAQLPHLALRVPIRAVPGSESTKIDRQVLESTLQQIHEAGLCRHSYVIVIGGGAVLDLVGFAAATAHRGLRLIRLPSTTLTQADSGVGVKNGINAFGKKNYLGTFTVPWGVINDVRFLTTLSDRDWRCGFSEAVKVALMKDKLFFERIEGAAGALARREWEPALSVIQRSCELHYEHIAEGGDPFELCEARPLDFGHWAAHRLEQLSHFRLRHGEAVAIGVAVDVVYSALEGPLPWTEAESIVRCLRNLGFSLYDPAMSDHEALLAGLDEFREHLGGQLTIPLLSAIGRSVQANSIDGQQMRNAIDYLCQFRSAVATRVPCRQT